MGDWGGIAGSDVVFDLEKGGGKEVGGSGVKWGRKENLSWKSPLARLEEGLKPAARGPLSGGVVFRREWGGFEDVAEAERRLLWWREMSWMGTWDGFSSSSFIHRLPLSESV